jgi:hypothetical protein
MTWIFSPIVSPYRVDEVVCTPDGLTFVGNHGRRKNILPFMSTDGGSTFVDLSSFPISALSSWPTAFIDSSGQYVYFVESDQYFKTNLYKSEDGGTTWATVADLPVQPESMGCSGSGQYLMGVYLPSPLPGDAIYFSSDYGDTWTIAEDSLPSILSVPASCISSDGAVSFVFVTFDTGSRIYYSFDTFATWSYISNSHRCGCLSSDGSIAYFGADGGVIYSTSDFSTFTEMATLSSLDDVQSVWCNSDGSIVLARTNYALWLSVDSGLTFLNIKTLGSFGVFQRGSCASDDGSIIYTSSNSNISLGELLKASDFPFGIISIDPNEGPTIGGQFVTISGGGFHPDATATIDGNALTSLEVVDHTTITGVTPPGTLGAKDVSVINP